MIGREHNNILDNSHFSNFTNTRTVFNLIIRYYILNEILNEKEIHEKVV